MKGKGALAYRPGQFDLTDEQRGRFDQLKANKGRKAARRFLARQDAKGNLTPAGQGAEPGAGEGGAPGAPEQQTPGIDQTFGNVTQGLSGVMGYINNRPMFQAQNLPQIPGVAGGFDASMQKYGDTIMSEFDRRMNPQFEREQEAFRQRMYEQGVPEGSEKFNQLQQQMMQQQNDARQSAMSQATQMGMQYQNQAFGQGLAANQNQFGQQYQTWQAPLEQLGAFSPYFQAQTSANNLNTQLNFQNMSREDQQAFAAQQAAQQHQYAQQLAQQGFRHQQALQGGAYRPPGPESFDQWKAKQDYLAGIRQQEMFDSAVISGGQQMPQNYPGFGGGFAAGFGQGVGMGIGGALT